MSVVVYVVVEFGSEEFGDTGIIPPSMATVNGGRKTVVCSWRGSSGIGASGIHVDAEQADRKKVNNKIVVENMATCEPRIPG